MIEIKELKDKDQAIVVQKNAATTAVAEIVEPSLAYNVVHYNQFSLKGDIATKKSILLTLGAQLEPKRKVLSECDKQLSDHIFYMFNNLDIRHNNRSKQDKYYKEIVAKMKVKELEKWYDELYQMCLLAFLELDQIERNTCVKDLRTQIEAV